MFLGLVGVGRIGAFHAETLRDLAKVDRLVVTDADATRAHKVADELGVHVAGDVDSLLASGPDGLVVSAATAAHASLVRAAAAAGIAVFCEKPLAEDIAGTREVIANTAAAGVALQVGFQRRFDPGYRAAREALHDGRLGWVHTLRATTYDPAPPPASYIQTSGGLYRDCLVHDFDVIRWLTGQEIDEVYATGSNRGEQFFVDADDVDTAAVVATLADGSLALIGGGRYNGGGYDVRLEVHGSAGTVAAGLEERAPLVSGEPGVSWPSGRPYEGFAERFQQAYTEELAAFVNVVAGAIDSPCTGEDALAALLVAEACELSRAQARPVRVAEVA